VFRPTGIKKKRNRSKREVSEEMEKIEPGGAGSGRARTSAAPMSHVLERDSGQGVISLEKKTYHSSKGSETTRISHLLLGGLKMKASMKEGPAYKNEDRETTGSLSCQF